jgi:hypothetical protein
VNFPAPAKARYLKIVARSEVNGNPFTAIAELDIVTDDKFLRGCASDRRGVNRSGAGVLLGGAGVMGPAIAPCPERGLMMGRQPGLCPPARQTVPLYP